MPPLLLPSKRLCRRRCQPFPRLYWKRIIPGWPVRRGKVRDIYDLGDRLLLVSTDRISAFDWVLPTGIPDKGRVLTQLSAFWFEHVGRAESHAVDRRRPISICRRASIAEPLAGRSDAGAQDGGRADRMRGARLSVRLGLEGIQAKRHGLRHQAAAGLDARATSCRSRSSRRPPRKKAATT